MKRLFLSVWVLASLILTGFPAHAADVQISAATQECLDCHAAFHPGIVSDWQKSRHAAVTPSTAMAQKGSTRRVSSVTLSENLGDTVVGCAECHTLRGEAHADTFEHNGYQIHLAPSPDDCAVCHVEERTQYAGNIMSMAEKNLSENTLYQDLQRTILGPARGKEKKVQFSLPEPMTQADTCYYCHGTRLKVTGRTTRETDAGEMEFPVIEGWPNQGVGRVNLDGSRGSCSACHTRHRFSIETARKPDTCKECHAGPDVPAYKVYISSKHGNIFSAHGSEWNFSSPSWHVGEHFTAPTCAVCHISQTVNTEGEVIAQRTHRMNDRLGWRHFGLIYAHPQPQLPDTTIIRNRSGLPLPTDLDGAPAKEYLISPDQIKTRRAVMEAVCRSCHGNAWVSGHFQKLDQVVSTSNAEVRHATELIRAIWKKGYASGPDSGGSMFDEAVERRWSDLWLIHANNIRLSSAMAGGGDYGVFDDGRYQFSKGVLELQDWLNLRETLKSLTP